MIELPSGPAVLADRLAALEDPILAERLFRENPTLFGDEPPRTQREILRWTTRRVGTAVIAVTAAVSIAAGYFGSELTRHATPAVQPAKHAAVILPIVHARSVAHHATPRAPARVAHHAAAARVAAPIVHVAPRVVYVAPIVQPHPDREAQLLRARLRAQELEVARLRAQAAAEHAAARVARAQARAGHRVATSAAAAPQSRPQSDPAAAGAPATARGQATAPAGGAADGPLPNGDTGGGVQRPPTNPGGVWNERIPGGTLGGMIPPIIVGVPRDSCTPRGGRVGAVMQVIQAAQIIQALSRH